MTIASATTIIPRRRGQNLEAPAPAVSSGAIQEIDAPPRVLIRLPAIAAAPQAAGTKPPPTGKPPAAAVPAKPIEGMARAGISLTDSESPLATVPWYGRLNTPRVKKYLPYAMVVAVLFIGVFWIIRNHAHKSKPVAADSTMPPWNNDAASPNRQVGGPSPAGPSNVPNWNGPAWPAAKGLPPGASPNAPANSPSAYEPPPASSAYGPAPPPAGPPVSGNYPGYPSNTNTVAPAGWPNAAGAPNAAAGSPADSVPPMSSQSPPWPNPPAGNQGVVQAGPGGPEYRTAAANDPGTIPPGRSPANAGDPGVAQFQGNIARP